MILCAAINFRVFTAEYSLKGQLLDGWCYPKCIIGPDWYHGLDYVC